MSDVDSTTPLKRCTKCGNLKPYSQYTQHKTGRDGLCPRCKSCEREYRAANADRKREYNRQYNAANAERIAERKHERYVETADRVRERNRAYHAANADRIHAKKREYYIANRDRINESNREYQREYYASNRERVLERTRAYHQTPRGKQVLSASWHKRRARKSGDGNTLVAADLVSIRASQTDSKGRLRCWICGKPIKGTPHLDHWVPLDKSGPNEAGNLHYTHARCNLEKHAKHPFELGRLL